MAVLDLRVRAGQDSLTEGLAPRLDRRSGIKGEEIIVMSSAASRAQSLESRDEILKAAMQLFAGRGFHETSMSEVAREARVSKALIFWHFKTKEDLFLAVLEKLLEPYFIDFAEEIQKLSPRDQIVRLVESYLHFVRENAGSVKFFVRRLLQVEGTEDAFTAQVQRLYEGYRSLLTDLVRKAQELGVCQINNRAESVVGLLMSALNGFLIEVLFMEGASPDLDSAMQMLRGLLFGEQALSVNHSEATR